MAKNLVLILTVLSFVGRGSTFPPPSVGRRLTVANRLLSLLTTGDVGGPAAEETRNTEEDADGAVKNVLDLLAPIAHSKPVTGDALEGLNALLAGEAKTPSPIDLTQKPPARAAVDYFKALGITADECQRRTICELLVEPQAGYGVFGELLSYVFGAEKPSEETLEIVGGSERYEGLHLAAVAGRRMYDCAEQYRKCDTSYKDYVRLVNL